jgi:uncharacterized membrane protein YhaH (DUF805 family)
MNYMIMPLKRYFDFSGRSRRKEYWMFVLFIFICEIVTITLDNVLGLGGTATSTSNFDDGNASFSVAATGGVLTMIFIALIIIPSIAAGVRRMHDQDKSGWFLLIPIYGFVLLFFEGTRGPNRFGPDPKGGAPDAEVFA